MASPDYARLVAEQPACFVSGATRAVDWRVAQSKAIEVMIDERRDAM